MPVCSLVWTLVILFWLTPDDFIKLSGTSGPSRVSIGREKHNRAFSDFFWLTPDDFIQLSGTSGPRRVSIGSVE